MKSAEVECGKGSIGVIPAPNIAWFYYILINALWSSAGCVGKDPAAAKKVGTGRFITSPKQGETQEIQKRGNPKS